MYELYVDGQYVDSYPTKWDALDVVATLPDGVVWQLVYFSGT